MMTIISHLDGHIEVMYSGDEDFSRRVAIELHIVVIDELGEWTDSPSQFTSATEGEQAETIANYHDGGFEDRNP